APGCVFSPAWRLGFSDEMASCQEGHQMQMTTYLSFRGQCEEAFSCYEATLGGRLGPIFRYLGTSLASQVPADWQDKVMHGSLTIGDQVLIGGGRPPRRYTELKR